MAWNCELVLVEEWVLDPLLVMLIAVEIVLLQIIEEAGRDRPYALDVHLRRAKLLLAVLDSILQIFQSKDQLQQTVRVQLERRRIVGALGHVVRLVEDNYRIFVV